MPGKSYFIWDKGAELVSRGARMCAVAVCTVETGRVQGSTDSLSKILQDFTKFITHGSGRQEAWMQRTQSGQKFQQGRCQGKQVAPDTLATWSLAKHARFLLEPCAATIATTAPAPPGQGKGKDQEERRETFLACTSRIFRDRHWAAKTEA